MINDKELEKITVWFNKIDLNLFGIQKVIFEIDTIKKFYGYCLVCSEDLTKKELEKLFGEEKNGDQT